jgi:ABC-2 type transport system ATP-binding protein
MAILQVESLTYQYGANLVLSDLSFELPEGAIAALIGRNGAGKSTLLRCLAGWTVAEQGTITIAGLDMRRSERDVRRHIVFVPDTPDFYDELTAWEHLQFVAQLHRIESWQERSLELLEEFQLDDQRTAFPFTFSRGMRYKLALCMALLVRPALLLLDEPFGPLDAFSAQYLWRHLLAYRTEQRSVLFSSHVMPEDGSPDLFLLLRDHQISPVDPVQVTGILQLLNDA